MIISKGEFVQIIKKLQQTNDFVNEVNKKAMQLYEAINCDFFNAMSLSISHETLVVELLEKYFDTDIISYWIYELDYGRKYREGCVQEIKGKTIDISTAEKLYDYVSKGNILNGNYTKIIVETENKKKC